jgi:hypothetical protein
MPVIVNEIEVIAPPAQSEENQQEAPPQTEKTNLTPHELYWLKRKISERRTRLVAR